MPLPRCGTAQVLATLVTVEEAPRDILDRVAAVAMKDVPQLVGVMWSKEKFSVFFFLPQLVDVGSKPGET